MHCLTLFSLCTVMFPTPKDALTCGGRTQHTMEMVGADGKSVGEWKVGKCPRTGQLMRLDPHPQVLIMWRMEGGTTHYREDTEAYRAKAKAEYIAKSDAAFAARQKAAPAATAHQKATAAAAAMKPPAAKK